MRRAQLFNAIEFKLSTLATRLELRGRLNLLELNLHSENFYVSFLNLLFSWQLKNLNTAQQNAPGLDLVDDVNEIVAQVSATATKQKIESALSKNLSCYKGKRFKFIAICKDAKPLRSLKYSNPHELEFSPADDILDVASLLAHINGLGLQRLEEVHDFLSHELKADADIHRISSNLAAVIGAISKIDWDEKKTELQLLPYDIDEKIKCNDLEAVRELIDAHKIHFSRIDAIYSEFDKQGANKSHSVLNGIRSQYIASASVVPADRRFLSTIERVSGRVRESANYSPLPGDELELCVQLLVVDAFIRCKIFRSPVGRPHACA